MFSTTALVCLSIAFYLPGSPLGTEKNLKSNELFSDHELNRLVTPDPAMIDFVNQHIDSKFGPGKKLERLTRAVFRKQHLGFQYDNRRTRDAREAFTDRRGNCVSLSLMFVTLARHVGLKARFQEAIPVGAASSGLLGNSRIHMNVVVGRDSEVDFNPNYMKKQFQRRFLSDEEALAHYYNNIGVESLRAGGTEQALQAARKAVACDPSLATAWNTMAICFKRREQYPLAREAYQTALAKDPFIIQARANWAAMEFDLGHYSKAATLFSGIMAKNQNPYRLFNRAQMRVQQGDLKGAEKLLLQAIRLNSGHCGFYMGLAEVVLELHRPAEAQAYFIQAKSLVTTVWDQRRIRERAPNFKTVQVARLGH